MMSEKAEMLLRKVVMKPPSPLTSPLKKFPSCWDRKSTARKPPRIMYLAKSGTGYFRASRTMFSTTK
ncbi:MAG: hypothetical protein BWY88_01371 [Synergistetes bacterium ADurb.Bin520]|nr:MAG: hypothetical protein BWY88_01371 [Synergistetes bacterium ADurb.Bin520]